jgi:hypothetical protein
VSRQVDLFLHVDVANDKFIVVFEFYQDQDVVVLEAAKIIRRPYIIDLQHTTNSKK